MRGRTARPASSSFVRRGRVICIYAGERGARLIGGQGVRQVFFKLPRGWIRAWFCIFARVMAFRWCDSVRVRVGSGFGLFEIINSAFFLQRPIQL